MTRRFFGRGGAGGGGSVDKRWQKTKDIRVLYMVFNEPTTCLRPDLWLRAVLHVPLMSRTSRHVVEIRVFAVTGRASTSLRWVQQALRVGGRTAAIQTELGLFEHAPLTLHD